MARNSEGPTVTAMTPIYRPEGLRTDFPRPDVPSTATATGTGEPDDAGSPQSAPAVDPPGNGSPPAAAPIAAPAVLDQILGAERYKLARNRDEIERDVGESRVGREFYPYLVVVFVLVLGLEHVLSNRFYRREES